MKQLNLMILCDTPEAAAKAQAEHLKNRGLINEAVDKVVDKISGRA